MSIAQSTHLQSYDYDMESQTLTITFQNGATYQYTGVSLSDFEALAKAGGGGTVFWDTIRNKYPATKISGPTR
jgi:hypothetical protein